MRGQSHGTRACEGVDLAVGRGWRGVAGSLSGEAVKVWAEGGGQHVVEGGNAHWDRQEELRRVCM